jgi:hypothetical protein
MLSTAVEIGKDNQPHEIPDSWSHDIRYIDGEFVEEAVSRFQAAETDKEREILIEKIFRNFSLFRNDWATAFAPYLDEGRDDGLGYFYEVLWRSARQFSMKKRKKKMGRAFNAYFVSALMNTEKNLKHNKYKKGPLIRCPICEEDVSMIDEVHLMHQYDIVRYSRTFVGFPISSWDGKITCLFTRNRIDEITQSYVNKMVGQYLLSDWEVEFNPPRGPFPCPVTGLMVNPDDLSYPSVLAPDYTEEDFVRDFPEFPGIVSCPVCKKRMLRMTAEHFASHARNAFPLSQLEKEFPNVTIKSRRVKVINPYTGEKVDEITLDMLNAAGTTVREHLEKHSTIHLGAARKKPFFCPFTGRKMRSIKKETLERIGYTPYEFYQATCEFPLRRFQVKCAICGDWVDNIGQHLDEVKHAYAMPMSPEEYEKAHGGKIRNVVVAKMFLENDDGERTSMADVVAKPGRCDIECLQDLLDMGSVFKKFARDDLDKKIINAIRGSTSLVEVCENTVENRVVALKNPFSGSSTKVLAREIRASGTKDFDVVGCPEEGDEEISIVVPSRETIFKRLRRMADEAFDSDHAV